MYVIKRDGHREPVHFDKISNRIQRLAFGLDRDFVDPALVTQKVCSGVYAGVTTSELDELAAETSANLSSTHPDYALLAARIAVSNLHKNTKKQFSVVMSDLYTYIEPKTGIHAPLLSKQVYDFIMENAETLDAAIVYARDFDYDYFGFKTLECSYLLRLYGAIVERPQHMLMRVACGIHYDNLSRVLETYNLMSQGWFTHASPTLFNSGTPRPQLSSCFLVSMKDDSIEGIYDTLKTCAIISKHAGGIGISCHNIRATNSYIRGTNGTSNGLLPMLRVFSNTARYVDQGGGKRKGAFAMYLEPWHFDVFKFIDIRKNHGIEEHRARDLFIGLWVPDLFMERVEKDQLWSLMCPDECPGLAQKWGPQFEELYISYENKGKAREVIRARTLWTAILEAQQETGTPFILYKDACNKKSNQQNLGTIQSSNLCTEIIEYTSPDEVAVCNLASINLSSFVVNPNSTPIHQNKEVEPFFNYSKLYEVTSIITYNLNRVIDINYYPVIEAKNSNMRHRPIGIGVQGLADALILMNLPYESEKARDINKKIFETIYYAALDSSAELAKIHGPYQTYEGSPMSKGQLQQDMWGVTPSNLWDWDSLRKKIATFGVRNSLLVAPMPTASTSQILGNNESFEPYTYNLYTRRTLAGEFVCVNKHLLRALVRSGLWNETLKAKLIAHNGSVQNIPEIPDNLKEIFKTVWEMKGKTLVDMAADRGAFIDQSQSFNVFMSDVNFAKLTSMHFYAWKKGLKTGMYYLRTRAAADAIKFTLDTSVLKETPTIATTAVKETIPVTTLQHSTSYEKPDQALTSTGNTIASSPLKLKQQQSSEESTITRSPIPNAEQHDRGSIIFQTKTPLTKAERDNEEELKVQQWRQEHERKKAEIICALDNKDSCLSCGS